MKTASSTGHTEHWYQLLGIAVPTTRIDTATLKMLWLMICNIEDKRAAQRAKKAKRNIECNGYIEGAKATGWKQAINQLAVAYPDRFADYL